MYILKESMSKKIFFFRVRRWLFLFSISLSLSFLTISSATTFTVTNVLNIGTGSFRWAITNANATAGSNIIAFKINGAGPFTINVTNALPVITNVVMIDGGQGFFQVRVRIGGATGLDEAEGDGAGGFALHFKLWRGALVCLTICVPPRATASATGVCWPKSSRMNFPSVSLVGP